MTSDTRMDAFGNVLHPHHMISTSFARVMTAPRWGSSASMTSAVVGTQSNLNWFPLETLLRPQGQAQAHAPNVVAPELSPPGLDAAALALMQSSSTTPGQHPTQQQQQQPQQQPQQQQSQGAPPQQPPETQMQQQQVVQAAPAAQQQSEAQQRQRSLQMQWEQNAALQQRQQAELSRLQMLRAQQDRAFLGPPAPNPDPITSLFDSVAEDTKGDGMIAVAVINSGSSSAVMTDAIPSQPAALGGSSGSAGSMMGAAMHAVPYTPLFESPRGQTGPPLTLLLPQMPPMTLAATTSTAAPPATSTASSVGGASSAAAASTSTTSSDAAPQAM
jgi:hypothetical protein